jgi:lathosterol oxidase
LSSEFRFGEGEISGVVSVGLSVLALGGVFCFYFPEILTTPELRAVYPVSVLRMVLAASIFAAFTLGAISVALSQNRIKGLLGVFLSILATVLGGSQVPVPDRVVSRNYIGLDWFILDILLVALIFIPFERLFARLKEQRIFRKGWQTDLWHFFFSHVLMQVTSFLILTPALVLTKYLALRDLQTLVQVQPSWLQFLEIIFIADLSQYWVHRLFHRIPILWRFHAVHHSSEVMDWLAGSRLHLVDIVATRGLTLIPLFLLGFNEGPLKAYLVFVAFWATIIHVNMRFSMSRVGAILATPLFHHWHHAATAAAVDKNFAIHFSFLDRLFNTYYLPAHEWPLSYGLQHLDVPEGYWAQTIYPLRQPRNP